MKKTFFDKPIGDEETFELLLFLVGNGCPYMTATKWILSSNIWAPDRMVKRVYEVQRILKNIYEKRRLWFYFDIIINMYLYLNGDERKKYE